MIVFGPLVAKNKTNSTLLYNQIHSFQYDYTALKVIHSFNKQ